MFAGKAFAKTKLRSADAVVITLFDQTVPGLGDAWNERSQRLARTLSSDWSIYPQSGHVEQSHLYEFRFKPMTLNDDLFLAASYMVTAIYVVMRMMQLRAVKSWFGLLITTCAKVIHPSTARCLMLTSHSDDSLRHWQLHHMLIPWDQPSPYT